MTNIEDAEFSKDLLHGAAEIAEFLFGDRNARRRVYYLATHSNLPVFKLGSTWGARKSVLLNHLVQQEQRHRASGRAPAGSDDVA